MKRAVMPSLLRIYSGCSSVCKGLAIAYIKRGRRRDELYHALSRCTFINDKPCCLHQCCRADRLPDTQLCLPVRVYGLPYVVRIVSGRVIECCSTNCA